MHPCLGETARLLRLYARVHRDYSLYQPREVCRLARCIRPQITEAYFHRHAIRAKKKGGMPKPGAKNAERTAALYEALQDRKDEELAEEVLRTWLLTKRPLLVAALDHLGIDHEEGLTESDEVSKFEKLSMKDTKALIEACTVVADPMDISVYLRFMGVPNVDEAMK